MLYMTEGEFHVLCYNQTRNASCNYFTLELASVHLIHASKTQGRLKVNFG